MVLTVAMLGLSLFRTRVWPGVVARRREARAQKQLQAGASP